MMTPLRFSIVMAAALVVGWAAFRFAQRPGLGAVSAARIELAGNREKTSALEEENRRLSVTNEELRAKLMARAQSMASAQAQATAAKAEPPPWELMRSIRRDKSATVHLTPFDVNTGKLSEGIAEIFALTEQERDSLERAVDDAHRELALLMVENATANTVEGKVELTVLPFGEGTDVRTRLLETFANTLGPDRLEVFNANIPHGSGLDQAFGGFGVGPVAGTIIRVPTGDSIGPQFRIGLRITTTIGSSATNVNFPNAAALPDSMRWLNILVPDLGNLPVTSPDTRANIAPEPARLRTP